jgi:hypothetical protein
VAVVVVMGKVEMRITDENADETIVIDAKRTTI